MLLTEFDEEKDWAIIARGYKEIGYEEGRKEERNTLIKTMLSNGATKETIINLAGISEEEFNNIINS